MPGMPYHLEKGPWLTVLEDYLNGAPGRSLHMLEELREWRTTGRSLALVTFLGTSALDGDPDYPTLADRREHLQRDWFGSTNGWAPSFADELLAPLGGDIRRAVEAEGVLPREGIRHAEELLRFADTVVDIAGDAVDNWPTTGFWFQYHGYVDGIVRESLIRSIEVSIGIDHDAPIPDTPDRALPIELYWKCPQRWFESWVTWRWDEDHGTGQVTTVLATPGSGKPVLENPIMGHKAFEPTTCRVDGDGEAPNCPAPAEPARNAGQSPKGMWVVTHAEHAQLPSLPTAVGTPLGDWTLPAFGPTYVGVGPVVCIQPSEADGGVRPFGRPFVDDVYTTGAPA